MTGCATPDFKADQRDPVCARQCLAVHAKCITEVPAYLRGGCHSNAEQCIGTCAPR